MKGKRHLGFKITSMVLFGLGLLFIFAEKWAMKTWPGLTIDEMVFRLTQPIQGTGGGILESCFWEVVLPSVLIFLGSLVLIRILKRFPNYWNMSFLTAMTVGIGLAFTAFAMFSDATNLTSYISSQMVHSTFIEDHYVDPQKTNLTFPEQKRNLIYIYMESMESTYSDQEDGGAFENNYIPELTALAQENINFSGNSSDLNGGIVYSGTGWTMGGIFAQSTGLPLQTELGNSMSTQNSFYPGITGLGNILEEQGYRQIFLCGSDVVFGGRKAYFTDHGNFEFQDLDWARETGRVDSDYYVWWGYEDQKLFDYAKETLTELAASGQPFNLTMLTADTHFEDGYVCPLCGTEIGDNQYANVIACSSRQIASFVQWIQQQDFYQNTTIVLSGDHTTMDSDFCDDVPSTYQRKSYVCFINPDAEVESPDKSRLYGTIDMFPTTLAALGVQIDGNCLGLGSNLFSDEETLTEKYGIEKVNTELGNKSEFLASRNKYEFTDSLYDDIRDAADISLSDAGNGKVSVRIDGLDDVDSPQKSITCILKKKTDTKAEDSSEDKSKSYYLEKKQDKDSETSYYETEIDLNKTKLSKNPSDLLTFTVHVKNGEGDNYSLPGLTIVPSRYLDQVE
jgi:phosphoglycerol transferase